MNNKRDKTDLGFKLWDVPDGHHKEGGLRGLLPSRLSMPFLHFLWWRFAINVKSQHVNIFAVHRNNGWDAAGFRFVLAPKFFDELKRKDCDPGKALKRRRSERKLGLRRRIRW